MKINLDKYIDGDIVLSGRERGEELRKKLELNKKENEYNVIEIEIPEEVCSINSSYFLGAFGDSIRKYGKEGFLQKYIFICDSIIRESIEDGISSALKERNALHNNE
ncbi:STAS-like domain-containing protein [Clostridium butyricum]|uniref:STAS-like domain-containing protein n=1 Tax=Clostridium butyricum TaxID=1492 RepID=UPI00374EB62A